MLHSFNKNCVDHGSHTPLQDDGDEPMMDLVTGLQTRYEHKRPDSDRDPT